MDENDIWQAFTETGDAMCYLLYRAAGNDNRRQADKTKERTERAEGETFPTAED